MPSRPESRERPGAPESNAGDEFHVLWAARRAVRLLDAGMATRRVVVEGVGPRDDPDGDDAFLGADLAEFEGGDAFDDADRTVLSQLKYSTRHPRREWTAARLAAGGHGPKQKRPVVYRLAQQLRKLRDDHGPEAVRERLSLRLVSNQPTSQRLLDLLATARALLTGVSPPGGTKRLLGRFGGDEAADLQRLWKASGLASQAFLDFVRVLDMTGTGEESVDLQRVRLVQELGLAATVDPTRGVRALERLIAQDASPQGVGSVGLTRSDVLAVLGVTVAADLFPAPAAFNPPENPVPVGEARALADVIVGAGGAPVVAHGPAGVGKTTTTLQVADHLPEGSEMVVYDCYGDGSYLNAGAERHTPRRALTQLTNELAVRFGTPLLLERGLDRPDLYQRFLDALDRAGRLVPEGAVLVVAVDAADNAAYAAQREGDESFVPRLLTAALPSSVRLLVTCRTHRIADLVAPDGTVEHELRGFDRTATATFVRRRFPEATDGEVAAIHGKTGGTGRSLANPRVQSYVLATSATVGEAVESAAATPQKIFDDLFAAAVGQAPDAGRALEWVGTLVAMGRPAPVVSFAALIGQDELTARRFVRALEPGVLLEGSGPETALGFRDEDFETDLRERVGTEALTRAHGRIADALLPLSATDPYAAGAVADHLFEAGRTAEVVRLVLDGPRPDAVDDPLARLRVNRRRAALGVRAAVADGDRASKARVIFAAAEFARGEEATLQLIREAPGLAVRFGDAETVAGIYVRESTAPWKGPAHLHAAVLLARAGDEGGALEHARAAEAWLRRWRSLKDADEGADWNLTVADVAHETEAAYWLRGVEVAFERATRWQPRSAAVEAARLAVQAVAARVGAAGVEEGLAALQLSPFDAASVVETAWTAGVVLDDAVVMNIAADVAQRATPRLRHRDRPWAVGFAEAVARAGGDEHLIRGVLDSFGPPPVRSVPTHFMGVGEIDGFLRVAVLFAAMRGDGLDAEALRPPFTEPEPEPSAEATAEVKNRVRQENKRRTEECERWDALVGAVLPAYLFRAEAVLGRVSPTEADEAVREFRAWKPGEDRHPGSYGRYRHRMDLWLDGLGFAGAGPDAVAPVLDALGEAGPAERATAWLEAARRVGQWTLLAPAVEGAVERAVGAVADEPLPARERWTVLWNAADLVQHHDGTWAAQLYAEAVEAASDLDDDGARLLGALAGVLESTGSAEPDEGGRSLAQRVARAVEHHAPYVSDEEHLPKKACVRAAAAVDAQAGLALAARWDDEDRYGLADGVHAVCVAAGATGGLPPEVAVPLLRLVPLGIEVSDDILPHLDRLRAEGVSARPRLSRLVEDATGWAVRDVPLRSRRHTAGRLVAWAEENGLHGLPGVEVAARTAAFADGLDRAERQRQSPSPPPTVVGERTPWQIEQEARDRAADAAYSAAVADARAGAFDRLGERLADAGYQNRRAPLLTSVREATPRRHRTGYLDALVGLDLAPGGGTLWADDVLKAFAAALRAWERDPHVRSWAPTGVQAFTERWLPWLIRRSWGVAGTLRTLFALPGLGDRGAEITVAAVARRVGDLSAEALLHVGGVLAEGFAVAERRALVGAVLGAWEATAELPPLPDDGGAERTTGGFLWSAFGHHDRAVRWRAMHAARAMVRTGDAEALLADLVAWSHRTDAAPYRDPSRVFYWQAALASLHALLLRLAHEVPGAVRPHMGVLADRALSPSFPHVQVRELARRAALALEADRAGTYDAATVERLRSANQPTGRSSENGVPSHNHYDLFWGEKKNDVRFPFDYMDQVSHWYRWAERRLDVPDGTVLQRADAWICDRWGLPDVDWRMDPRSRDPYDRRDARVYKGSYPRLMGTREHLTLHAMLCAVGELLDEGVSLREDVFDTDDDYDSWARWMETYLPASDELWVHDLLGPTPLDPLWWGEVPGPSEWADSGGLADYDRLLGLPEGSESMDVVPCDEIVVRESAEAWASGAYDYVRVNSCLVTPETAEALQRSCQSNPDFYSNPMPTGWHDDLPDAPGFIVRPWVGYGGPEEGLDTFDPFTFGRGLSTAAPLDTTASAMGLVQDGPAWRDASGAVVFRLEAWADKPPGREESYEPHSTGTRLWVRVGALLAHLNTVGLDLLVEAGIQHHDRRDRSYGTSSDERRDDGHAVYTLVRRDGSFRSLDFDRRFGRAAGP